MEFFAGMHTHRVNGALEFGSAFGGSEFGKMLPEKIIFLSTITAAAVAKILALPAHQFALPYHSPDATADRLGRPIKIFANCLIRLPGLVKTHQPAMNLGIVPIHKGDSLISRAGVRMTTRDTREIPSVVERCDA